MFHLALKALLCSIQGRHVLIRTDSSHSSHKLSGRHQVSVLPPGLWCLISLKTNQAHVCDWVIVRFSSASCDSIGTQQDCPGPLLGAVNSPPVALAWFTVNLGPFHSDRESDIALQTSCPAALGLAPSQSLSQGLEEAVLSTIGNAKATSSHANYDQRRVFSTWCHKIQSLAASSLFSTFFSQSWTQKE